jgi:hypothetical protein
VWSEHGAPVAGQLASFTTAPEQDEHTDVHFVWGGDIGSGMAAPPMPICMGPAAPVQ